MNTNIKTIARFATRTSYGAYRTVCGSRTYQVAMLPVDVMWAVLSGVGTVFSHKVLSRVLPRAAVIQPRPVRVEVAVTFESMRRYRNALSHGEGIAEMVRVYEETTTSALDRINWDSSAFAEVPEGERVGVEMVASEAIETQCVHVRSVAKKVDAIVSDWTGAAPSDRL